MNWAGRERGRQIESNKKRRQEGRVGIGQVERENEADREGVWQVERRR